MTDQRYGAHGSDPGYTLDELKRNGLDIFEGEACEIVPDLIAKIEELTKSRDECANVFKIDRAHEMNPCPVSECACPSCELHHLYKEKLATLERLGGALRYFVADSNRIGLDSWAEALEAWDAAVPPKEAE